MTLSIISLLFGIAGMILSVISLWQSIRNETIVNRLKEKKGTKSLGSPGAERR
jgi:hypothetical protein